MYRNELCPSRAVTCVLAVTAVGLSIPAPSEAQFTGLSFGGAASERTARIAFDNPAWMVMLEREEYLLGTVFVENDLEFEGSSAQYFGPRVEGGSSSGLNTGLNAFYARPTEVLDARPSG